MAQNNFTHSQYEALLVKQLDRCQQRDLDSQVGIQALERMAGQYLDIVCHHRILSLKQASEELGIGEPKSKARRAFGSHARTPTPRKSPKCVKARLAIYAAMGAAHPPPLPFIGGPQ
jgi:hypothetical protein